MKEHGAPLRGCTPLEGERQGQASVQPVHVPGALRTRPTRFPSESHPPRGPPAATVAGAQIGPCCSLPLPASSPSLLPRPPLPRSSEVTSSERTPRTRRVPGPHPLGSSDALSAWQCPSTALITAWHRGLAIACLPCPTAEWASCSVPASGMARRAGVWARRWEAQTLPWGLVTWVLAGSWEPAPPAHCAEHLSCSPGFLPPPPPRPALQLVPPLGRRAEWKRWARPPSRRRRREAVHVGGGGRGGAGEIPTRLPLGPWLQVSLPGGQG